MYYARQKNSVGEKSGPVVENSASSLHSLRLLVWLYFWLLLWEGALRKWFFPSLSTPLLVVRDPVVLLIYAIALAKHVFPFNRFPRTKREKVFSPVPANCTHYFKSQ